MSIFLMALIISLVVLGIAYVKESKLKAIIYGLPLPITSALIASKTTINSTHVIGLSLLCLFLWSVYFFIAG